MAKGQTIDELSVSLGLDISNLDKDFVAADRTVSQNISKLQRELQSHKLKIQAIVDNPDLTPLERQKKLIEEGKERERLLVEQIKLATLAYQEQVRTVGEGSNAAINANNKILKQEADLQKIRKENAQLLADMPKLAGSSDSNKRNLGIANARENIRIATANPDLSALEAAKVKQLELERIERLQAQAVEASKQAYQQLTQTVVKGSEEELAARLKVKQAERELQETRASRKAAAAEAASLSGAVVPVGAKSSNAAESKVKAAGAEATAGLQQEASMLRDLITMQFVSPVLSGMSSVFGPQLWQKIRDTVKAQTAHAQSVEKIKSETSAVEEGISIAAQDFRELDKMLAAFDRMDLKAQKKANWGKKFEVPKNEWGFTAADFDLKNPYSNRVDDVVTRWAQTKAPNHYFDRAMDPSDLGALDAYKQGLKALVERKTRLRELDKEAIANQAKQLSLWEKMKAASKIGDAFVFNQSFKSDLAAATEGITAFKNKISTIKSEIDKIDTAWHNAAARITATMRSGLAGKNPFAVHTRKVNMMDFSDEELMRGKPGMSSMGPILSTETFRPAEEAFKKADAIMREAAANIREHAANISAAFRELPGSINIVKTAFFGLKTALGALGRMSVLGAAATAIGVAITKIAHSAIASKNAVYMLAQQLHSSISDTAQLNRAISLVDGNTDMVVSSIMRLDKQLLTAGASGNTATRMLDAFGVSLKKDDGTLKSYADQLAALAEGYQRAKAAGMSGEFMTETMGTRGKDMTALLEEYRDVMAQAKEIKSVSIIGPEQAHGLELQYNQLKAQIKSFGSALSQAFAPAAEVLMPHLLNVFQELTQIINNHKSVVIALSRFAGGFISGLVEMFNGLLHIADKVLYVFDAIVYTIDLAVSAIARLKAKMEGWNDAQLKAVLDEIDRFYGFKDKKAPEIAPLDTEAQRNALTKLNADAQASAQQQKQAAQEAERAHESAARSFIEAERSMYHATHTSGQSIIYDIQSQAEEEVQAAKTVEEACAARAKAAGKLAEVYAQAHQSAVRNFAEAETSFETIAANMQNPLDQVRITFKSLKDECDAQLDTARTAEEAESIVAKASGKMAEAWKNACDAIADLNQSLEDKLFHLTHGEYENAKYDAAREYNDNIKKGADPELAKKLYWAEIDKADEEEEKRERQREEQREREEEQEKRDREAKSAKPKVWEPDKQERHYHKAVPVFATAYNKEPAVDIAPIFQKLTPAVENLNNYTSSLAKQNASQFSYATRSQLQDARQAQQGRRQVDYNLNVNVYGVDGLSKETTDKACAKIFDGMPNIKQLEMSYAV